MHSNNRKLQLALRGEDYSGGSGGGQEGAGAGDGGTAGPALLDRLLDSQISDGRDFTSQLLHRLSSLRILQGHWAAGDVAVIVAEMQVMYESNRALTLRSMQPRQGQGQGQGQHDPRYVMDSSGKRKWRTTEKDNSGRRYS